MDFFQTVMGHRFYEGDVPRIAKALTRIADRLDEEAALRLTPPVPHVWQVTTPGGEVLKLEFMAPEGTSNAVKSALAFTALTAICKIE